MGCKSNGYHRDDGVIKRVNPPPIKVNKINGRKVKNNYDEEDGIPNHSSGIKSGAGRGRGWGNVRGSGWRGRGRGGTVVNQRGRGRGRGFQANNNSNATRPKPYNSQRQNGQTPNVNNAQMRQANNQNSQMQQPGMP